MTSIRLAEASDIPKLAAVERSAATIFQTVPGLEWIADGGTTDPILLDEIRRNGTLWIVTTRGNSDEPIAFSAGHSLDNYFYIAELSVMAPHQRQGIGGKLMATMQSYAEGKGYRAMTLTTYRDVSWNGPYYAYHGYVEVEAKNVPPGHEGKLREEEAAGHDYSRRCVMLKLLPQDSST